MYDNIRQVERLLDKLNAALPLATRATPALAAKLREEGGDAPPAAPWQINQVSYAGDQGGVMCRITFEDGRNLQVAITHLSFDPRLPVARDIAAYQKHRIKRIRLYDPANFVDIL
jgi:hypothetical protein